MLKEIFDDVNRIKRDAMKNTDISIWWDLFYKIKDFYAYPDHIDSEALTHKYIIEWYHMYYGYPCTMQEYPPYTVPNHELYNKCKRAVIAHVRTEKQSSVLSKTYTNHFSDYHFTKRILKDWSI